MRAQQLLKRAATGTRSQVLSSKPTEAQKSVGNYPKIPMKINGMNISIENPSGSYHEGTSEDGKKWKTKMYHDYGYVRGTEARDGDQVDVFLSTTAKRATEVHIIDQVYNGKFDEHKCMIGFKTQKDAKKAYLKNYGSGWQGCGAITTVSMEEFKKWIKSPDVKKPYSRQLVKLASGRAARLSSLSS